MGRLFRCYGFATILAVVACGSWKSSVNVDAGACRSRIVPNGLRGAGKSTVGSLIIIFDLYGPNGYRRVEREALESILKQILRGTIIYK